MLKENNAVVGIGVVEVRGVGGGGGQGGRGWWESGVGVVGVWVMGWGSRCHSIDQLQKLWLLHFDL